MERSDNLPLTRLLRLYFDPFALFKDATHGNRLAQELALSYNRSMRWMLLTYLRRWSAIAVSLFLAIAPAEALAGGFSKLPAATFAVGSCIAVAVATLILAAYLLLSCDR